ncbi:DUF5682 family protein [Stieleria sp. JC731]|uniref:DUF5682 family protein n=1 Tax=Pirellulaceae TaxID=2691357 RepID=UPI001E5F579C|nr:DUF5682 family protein [Stieleria sp. JC731]MCC9600285.1 DUF5682 family protein [Stieleria sp. JC731]
MSISEFESAADQIEVDVQAVARLVDSVLSADLYWFPVRHHSPSVAKHLEMAIHARKPKLIFIEGPAEANSLIPFIVDSQSKPPIAIYSSYRDDDNVLGLAGVASPAEDIPPRFSCWYPLLSYSPEYVAMLAAKKVGAEVRFMDLPHHALLTPADQFIEHPQEPVEQEADESKPVIPKQVIQREDESLFVESSFYQQLAKAAGYKTWAEAWDTLFESRDWKDDVEAFRLEMATFCAAVRSTTSPDRIATDGTLPRERFMMQTIRETLKSQKLKPRDAMVVCGGFHLFLDQNDDQPPPVQPEGTLYSTVVPYSFFRVSELSGYAAGNRAPQFYQSMWELTKSEQLDDLLAQYVVAVLNRARRSGESVSSADAISVSQHARMLAQLRGRPVPILDDIQDALVTCCCKGNPQDEGTQLLKAIDFVNIGTKVGRVTAKLGRLPIVNDFYSQIDDLQLDEVMGKEKQLTVSLDKRDKQDERRSVLLHRLCFLEIPLVKQIDAPNTEFATGTLFKERWSLKWNPKVEPTLVEQNLYGDSIEAAVLAKLHEEVARDEGHAGRTCGHLRRSIEMDLPNLVAEVQVACGDAIDSDSRFVSLTTALGHLLVIDRFATYRNLRRDELQELIVLAFDRACFSITDVCNVPEDQQPPVIDALLSLADIMLKSEGDQFSRDLFAENVRSAAEESTVPFLRGAFLGMLTEIRSLPAQELANEISAYASAAPEQMIHAGDFLDGVMSVSRTSIMLGADSLVSSIDDLLKAADWDTFLIMIPKMRAAFERLHPAQTDTLALRVATSYGLAEEASSLTELNTSLEAAALIASIDSEVAKIMTRWNF